MHLADGLYPHLLGVKMYPINRPCYVFMLPQWSYYILARSSDETFIFIYLFHLFLYLI